MPFSQITPPLQQSPKDILFRATLSFYFTRSFQYYLKTKCVANAALGTKVAAAAAAASLQSCPTLCDPIDGSPPGFPSLGFSRQEHWSGLPFPSPMHEREK